MRELSNLIAERGKPKVIVSDNGTELTSNAVLSWSGEAGIRELIVNRRQYLLATLSAAATVPAMRASAAAQFVATPSVTSLDEGRYPEAWKVQRSTLVVDGLDGAALTEEHLEMLKAGGVDCWHQSVGGLSAFANVLSFCDQHSQTIVQAGTVREIRQARKQGKIAHVSGW